MVTPGAAGPPETPDASGKEAEPDASPPPGWDLLSVVLLIFFVGLLVLVAALVGLPVILG